MHLVFCDVLHVWMRLHQLGEWKVVLCVACVNEASPAGSMKGLCCMCEWSFSWVNERLCCVVCVNQASPVCVLITFRLRQTMLGGRWNISTPDHWIRSLLSPCLTVLRRWCSLLVTFVDVIMCSIAIAYSMGQIIKLFCVCACACVCLSVCVHSHGRISLSIFTKLDTDV